MTWLEPDPDPQGRVSAKWIPVLLTNAERVCAEIMLNQKPRSAMVIQSIALA
jgi:hypothetical protein